MTAVMNVTLEQDVQTFPGISFRLPGSVLNDETFLEFCQLNPELRIERNAQKVIFIMAPTTSETGNKNFEIGAELAIWNRKHQLGEGFDSSTGFKLGVPVKGFQPFSLLPIGIKFGWQFFHFET